MGTLTMFRRFFLGSKQEEQSNKGRPKSVHLGDTAKNQISLFHAYPLNLGIYPTPLDNRP